MAPKKVLAEIKQDLESFVGNRIRLKANRGRNKVVERVGILEQTYPNIFVVKLDEKKAERRVSYSYTDVLNETVELIVCHQDGDIKITSSR
ncbi:MAG: Veg protein [Firmicutes bacterium]|nr:Veg protein [Bacillota bacterium]